MKEELWDRDSVGLRVRWEAPPQCMGSFSLRDSSRWTGQRESSDRLSDLVGLVKSQSQDMNTGL